MIRFALLAGAPYRVRFWGDGIDTIRKVPDRFWRELGHASPKKRESRFDNLAIQWAGRECKDVKSTFTSRPSPKQKKTLAESWEIYKRENPDGVAPLTIARGDNCANAVAQFLEHINRPDILPDDVDIALATKYRNWRTGVSARTVWNELTWLKQVCNFALAWSSETGAEAVRLVKLPYVELPESPGVALTEEEFGKVLEIVKGRDREILIAGVTTRLRRKNLLGLRGEDFDIENRWLTIARATMKGGRRKVRHDLSVPVAGWTLEQVGDRTAGLLWPSKQTGRAIVWVEEIVRPWASQAGVRAFSLHDLRTTGNSWLDAAGVDKMTQRHLLGHAEPADVTDIYRRKFEPELRAAVDVFDQVRKRNRW